MNLEIKRLRSEAVITALVGPSLSAKWWNSRNKAFDLKTPNEMWEIDSDIVYNYIMAQGFGGEYL